MAVGGVDYASPVTVHGFSCRNCAEVDLATKNIDPSHPKSGPNNKDAASDTSRGSTDPVKVEAARKAAETSMKQVVGYSAAGVRTAEVSAGALFSITA